MLSLLRKNAGSWIIKVVLGAIVIVFVFWGVGSYREREASRVAEVNGTIITYAEFSNEYGRMLENLRERMGEGLNEELIRSLQLRRQAIDQLIDRRLLLDEAARQDLRVTNNELSDSIMGIPAFQLSGQFDQRAYEVILSRNRLNPEQFEAAQRDALLIDKLQTLLANNTKVSTHEAEEFYRWQNTSVDIDYYLFTPDTYSDIFPKEEEIRNFYEDHKSNYLTEAKVQIRYLNFDSPAYASQVSVIDDEIQDYYDSHPDEFNTPKTVEARHILIKVEPDAEEAVVEQRKQKALDVLKLAREGQDFSELAKEHSEGPTGKAGGSLGAFRHETMEKSFSDKAFSMTAGDIGEPVRTRFGWHIIKVDKINEASVSPIEDARTGIAEKLTDEKAKGAAFDAAQDVYDSSFEGDDLINAAEAGGMSVLTSSLFAKKNPDKALRSRTKVADAAFELSPMEISEIIDHGDGYYIIQVVDKIPEKTAEFGEVMDEARGHLIKELQDDKARDDAEKLLARLKNGEDTSGEDDTPAPQPESTGYFKRGAGIPKIGYEREITAVAFELTPNSPVAPSVIRGARGYYVIRQKNRKLPEMAEFDTKAQEIRDQLLQQKKSTVFSGLLQHLRDASTIDIEERFLD